MNTKVCLAGTIGQVTFSINEAPEFDAVGTEAIASHQIVTGTAAALNAGSVTTPQALAIFNPSGSGGNILVALDSSCASPYSTIRPGRGIVLDYPTLPVYVKASAGSISAPYAITE